MVSGRNAGEKARFRCRYGAVALFWVLSVLLCALALLGKGMDGVRFASLTAASTFAGVFEGIVLPGDGLGSSSLHLPPGTRQPEADLAPVQRQIDCFSETGRWIYNATPRYMLPTYFSYGYTHECRRRFTNATEGRGVEGDKANAIAAKGKATDWIVREELKWEWQSDEVKCPLLPFDREHLCRLIGPRQNMLILGDSINQQIYWIMLDHLVANRTGYTAKEAWNRRTRGFEVCADVLGPGQGFNLSYVRNDRLSSVQHDSENPDHNSNFYEYPWTSLMDDWNVSVLLLNRGAHFEPDAILAESLTNLFALISVRWPRARVFYRNTPPGHINCTDHHEPLKVRESYETLNKYAPKRFHWAEFPRQNEIARNITRSFGYVFMDFDSLMALRPDGHIKAIDCLHYCVPGPMNVFANLFYNTLSVLESP